MPPVGLLLGVTRLCPFFHESDDLTRCLKLSLGGGVAAAAVGLPRRNPAGINPAGFRRSIPPPPLVSRGVRRRTAGTQALGTCRAGGSRARRWGCGGSAGGGRRRDTVIGYPTVDILSVP